MDWLTAHKLSLNISKTKYVLITNKHASTESFAINVNGNRIGKNFDLQVLWCNCRWKTSLERAL